MNWGSLTRRTSPNCRPRPSRLAAAAFEEAGWHAQRSIRSPFTGRRGAVEYLLHLHRGHP